MQCDAGACKSTLSHFWAHHGVAKGAPFITAARACRSQEWSPTTILTASSIDLLRNQSQVIASGAQLLTGLVGTVDIPRQITASTAHWVENRPSVDGCVHALDFYIHTSIMHL
jgi:ribosomal protein S8E